MIHLNQPAIPAVATAFDTLANSLGVIALITILTFSQQSHATNIWLWSWLAINGTPIVRDGGAAPAKDAAEVSRLAKAAQKLPAATNGKPQSQPPASAKTRA